MQTIHLQRKCGISLHQRLVSGRRYIEHKLPGLPVRLLCRQYGLARMTVSKAKELRRKESGASPATAYVASEPNLVFFCRMLIAYLTWITATIS